MKDEIAALIAGCGTYEQVQAVVADWMDYYNKDRYQWDLEALPGVLLLPSDWGYPLKPGIETIIPRALPRTPGLALWFPGGSDKKGSMLMHTASRKLARGARVAPQRCPILPGGKAATCYHIWGHF
ncbi:MAG: IS3 family transposase [Flavonifractor plautii]